MSRISAEGSTTPVSPLNGATDLVRLECVRRLTGRNRTKADILVESLGNLSAAAEGALSASFEGLVEGDFVASFKVVTCALPQLGDAAGMLTSAGGSLSGEASASLEVLSAAGAM